MRFPMRRYHWYGSAVLRLQSSLTGTPRVTNGGGVLSSLARGSNGSIQRDDLFYEC